MSRDGIRGVKTMPQPKVIVRRPPFLSVPAWDISDMVDQAMSLLAGRGMARKTEGKWHAIAPGRLEPSTRRAVAANMDNLADFGEDRMRFPSRAAPSPVSAVS